jgi:hypothetical protein
MWVDLTDGRILGGPLAWLSGPADASLKARRRAEISRVGG